MIEKHKRLSTKLVQFDHRRGVEHGAFRVPIHSSTQYGYEKVEDFIGVFQGAKKGSFNYARQGTPTTAALEAKINELEQGVGTVCFATGMGALASIFFGLLKAGDHIVASSHIFGNTNSLLGTLRQFGVTVSMVDMESAQSVANSLTTPTKMVFAETVANPGTQIADLEGIGALCNTNGLLFVVDNTVTSAALFQPAAVGAGLVVNSLSKIMSGHGAALGGAVTDTGLFDWSRYPNIAPEYRGVPTNNQGLSQLRKKGLRDMGGSLSSEQANQISVGMETLPLRIGQSSANAQRLAEWLASQPQVRSVHYPGLPTHPQYRRAEQLFGSGGYLLSFELCNEASTNKFLDSLQIAIKATGLGDTRTLVIPVASTIFWEAGPAKRQEMEIPDGLIRMSVGLEHMDDLIEDLSNALAAIR